MDEELLNVFEPAATRPAGQQQSFSIRHYNNQVVDWTEGRFQYNATSRSCSILMIGSAQVGKTTIAQYWINNESLPDFAHSEHCTYNPTVRIFIMKILPYGFFVEKNRSRPTFI